MEPKGIMLGGKDNLKKSTVYDFTYVTLLKWQFIEMETRLEANRG